MAAPEKTFRDSPRRSVVLETRGDGNERRRVVCKHFHSPASVLGLHLRDRLRARRELAILETLRQRGVAVPRPLGLERTEGGWQAVLEWIPETVELEQVLRGNATWPAPEERIARRLGALLAAVHGAGLDHPDLHPGNVLVDGGGAVWLIDFHQARPPGRTLRPEVMERDLAALAARGREAVSRRFRARFFLSYLRHLSPELREQLGERNALIEGAEARGRLIRRETVFRFRTSWLKKSGNTRVLPGGRIASLHAGPVVEGEELVVRASTEGALVELWHTGARLAMHGIPCTTPVVLDRHELWASFAGRGGAVAPLKSAAIPPARRRRFARELGQLFGALHDRGLSLERVAREHIVVDAASRPLLTPTVRLVPREEPGRDIQEQLAMACDLTGAPHSPTERAAFVAGYAASFLGSAGEARRIRERARRGA